jgi:hypothetical protein
MSGDVIVNNTNKVITLCKLRDDYIKGLTNAVLMQWNIILVFRILVQLLKRGVDFGTHMFIISTKSFLQCAYVSDLKF